MGETEGRETGQDKQGTAMTERSEKHTITGSKTEDEDTRHLMDLLGTFY